MNLLYIPPVRGENLEIVAYLAYKLSYIKFLMGHLDLAIDLGKTLWAEAGRADLNSTPLASDPKTHRACAPPRPKSPQDVGTDSEPG